MGNVLWHTPLSLDGFIAGPDDAMGWGFDVDGRTSRIACKRGGAFRGPFFVLRHDPPAQPLS
jgi:hypothetical protein